MVHSCYNLYFFLLLGNRGGINRNYRKRNTNNANSNSGDESDTSVASSKK